jgi:threonine dehydrogenase-like Zn-dependent dehydrogenase
MTSHAVWFTAKHRAEIRSFALPEPAADEVQVRCVANGICMGEVSLFDDIETSRWPLPRIVGHEGVGVVTKVGAGVATHREGDWVVCREWATLWNRKASAATKLTRAPGDPTTFLAEPCECAVNSAFATAFAPGDRVCLLGAGFMGLLNVQLLRRYPLAEFVVVDPRDKARLLARRCGATSIYAPNDPSIGSEFDVVIECAGAGSSLDSAVRLVRPGGKLALFSWHHAPRPLDLGELHLKGVHLLNTGPAIVTDSRLDFMARAVRLIEAGVFDLAPLVTHRHKLADVQTAMELALNRPPGYIKGVLDFT